MGMTDEARLKPCSFFVVRYVPDLVRDEGLNIGLFLYSPQEEYLDCLFTQDFRRLRTLHPQADLELLRELQGHFEREIKEREGKLEAFLSEMQETYSNLIQLTTPRTCLAVDPQAELQALFERYVGARPEAGARAETRMRVKQKLHAALDRAGALKSKHLERKVPAARWTGEGDPFTFDYGYRPLEVAGRPNGHYRFIHALTLKGDADLAKLLAYTIGKVREKEPADLSAVVDARAARDDETALFSQRTLEEAEIALVPLAEVDSFAQSVARELAV
jgi:hypothetical protein